MSFFVHLLLSDLWFCEHTVFNFLLGLFFLSLLFFFFFLIVNNILELYIQRFCFALVYFASLCHFSVDSLWFIFLKCTNKTHKDSFIFVCRLFSVPDLFLCFILVQSGCAQNCNFSSSHNSTDSLFSLYFSFNIFQFLSFSFLSLLFFSYINFFSFSFCFVKFSTGLNLNNNKKKHNWFAGELNLITNIRNWIGFKNK